MNDISKERIIETLLDVLVNIERHINDVSIYKFGLCGLIDNSTKLDYLEGLEVITLLFHNISWYKRLWWNIVGTPQYWFYDKQMYKISNKCWYGKRIKLIKKTLKQLGYSEK